jgi:hypothetical protein
MDDDYGWLLRSEGKTADRWSCPKRAQVGDLAFIYVAGPKSQVVAMARVRKPPRPGHEAGSQWRYVTRIGPIKLLPAPISLAELKELCPDWGWLRYPRAYAYVPAKDAKRLLRRSRLKSPPAENAEVEVSGAGFGDPDTNRRIERAAVDAVKRHYKRGGFKVRSCERDNLGYDLEVKNGRTTLHVEVKGISGAGIRFPITAGEVNCAARDASFRLAVVTDALNGRSRKVHIYTGRSASR